MRHFLVVHVDPAATVWKDLRYGYRVFGELIVDDIANAVTEALPRDPDLTYVDLESGRLHRWIDGQMVVDGHLLAILGYPEIAEVAARDRIIPLLFERPRDPHTAHVAANLFNEALGNDGRNDDYGLALKAMAAHGHYQMHRRDLFALIRRVMRRANGSIAGSHVGDLLPGLRL